MWLAHCPLCLWSSDSSERLKNVLSDKSLDLLKVVWLRVPNSLGNLNSWHGLGWMVVVPCAFVRAAQSLHLTSGIVQEIFLDQEKLWRPEYYWIAEVVGFQPKRKPFCRQWRNPAHVLSPLHSAALVASLQTKMLQEHPSLTLSCDLYPLTFWNVEEYHLLERDLFLYQLSLFPLFFICIMFLSFLSQIYFFCTAIPFLHCRNLHFVHLGFLSLFFFSVLPSFSVRDISFPYFLLQFFFILFSISLSQTLCYHEKI